MHAQEPVLETDLHAFGDASSQGVGAAVYAVIKQQRCRNPTEHSFALIQYEELAAEEKEFVREAQAADPPTVRGAELNVTVNGDGLLVCRGKIIVQYPIYLPRSALLAESSFQSSQPHLTFLGVIERRTATARNVSKVKHYIFTVLQFSIYLSFYQ